MALTRRRFLQHLGAAAGSGLLVGFGSARRASAQSTSPRVVTVTDGRAWSGDGWSNADLDRSRIEEMLRQALCELTDEADASAALARLIPAVADPSQRYGVKVNAVNEALPSHPAVATALAGLLVEAGASAERITVFDRQDDELVSCGFTLGLGEQMQVYGTDHDGYGYEETGPQTTAGEVRLSRILTEHSDHLINLPVLKNHTMAGVTLALKNHFGSILNPMAQHGSDNDGCPGISEVAALAAIRERTRLIVIDATFGTYQGGLAGEPEFAPMSLILATDPVAADAVGMALINERRLEAGLDAVSARHLTQAAAAGLGEGELDAIDRRSLELSPVEEKAPPPTGGCAAAGAGAAGAAAAVAGVIYGACRRRKAK